MGSAVANANCPLNGTKYCRMLNMRACANCTVRDYESFDELMRDLDVYEELLPEGGISGLFTDPLCQLCKVEPRRQGSGYAVLYMAHPEPKHIQKHLFGKRTAVYGTMVPLQFTVCSRCRRRLIAMEYLPGALPLIAGILGLAALCLPNGGQNAIGVGVPLPFIIWLAVVVLAAVAGRLIAKAAEKEFSETTEMDVLNHPVVREMLEKGWTPVVRRSRTKVFFSLKRLPCGLGTANSAAEEKE